MRWLRSAAAVLVLWIACAAPLASQSPVTVTVTVSFALVPIAVDALPYFAEDLGYFRQVGLDAHIATMSNGPAVAAAVASGAVDVGFSNAFSLSAAHEKGLQLQILFGTEIAGRKATNGILTVLADSPIRTAKDLTGKTVAVSGLNSTNEYAVENWIDKNGGDAKSVKYIEVPPPAMGDTLMARRVDAASMDAVNLVSHEKQFRVLAPTYAAIARRFIGGGYFTSTAWLAAHQDLAVRIVAALRRAAMYANAHTAEAQRLYAAHSRFSLAEIQETPFPTYSTEPTPALYQPLIDLAARYGLLKQPFPASELVSPIGLAATSGSPGSGTR